ncbi:hypothetical protein VA596_06340 [Amycolatopsis sp., V23-08]|uniref:Uncharacterized protein n=1 Tax=Amycolatopsis heterodermiae TaxID=3110235 RepID=A0ABU5QZU5_9PSEU|nr:hypothetical protein [Amycolatopsis sp., V23-08]MEA5359150.1 hypothetical protein [Amycolatopsis sp., V23-08]
MLDTDVLSTTRPRALGVDTPLGTVRFAVRVGGWDVPARPELTWGLDSGAWLCRWRHRSVRLDVLSGPSAPQLPDGYPAVTRQVTVFRVLAREPLSEFVVQVELSGPEDMTASGASVTAETADAVVTVGGPDVEALRACARAGQHVPPYWSGALAGDAVGLDDGRLTWQLPAIERGDYADLWVAAAWSEPSEHPGTRRAVDVDPARVLRELTH